MERTGAWLPGRPALLVLAAALAGGCAPPPIAEAYPQLAEYAGREIEAVSFVNTAPFSADTLEAMTETEDSDCTLVPVIFPFCFPGTDWGRNRRYLSLNTVGADVSLLSLFYRQHGYFGTVVIPEIEDLEDENDAVEVRFRVQRGDGIVLDSLVVEGTEGVVDPDSLEQELPLQAGELFDLGRFLASADTVTAALRARGHAYAEVLRNYAVDTLQDRATAWLIAIPGPRVAVDSILIAGEDKLDRRTTLRYVPFTEGDLLRRRSLQQAQRDLYELELVQFANVQVAPDSLQLTPEDSSTATILVQLSEAPEHVVEMAVGWGSVECFRSSAQWTDRSLFRGARRLTLTGSVSRIGIGGATDVVGHDLCTAGRDTFATGLDYRLSGELTQPYFLTVRNQLVLGAFTERQSEPMLYQRTAHGTRLNLTHRLGTREALTGAVDVERRQIQAVPALYCYAFAVCQPEDLAELSRPRWRNALGASWLRDRGNSVLDPTAGHVLQASTQWATSLLGSDYDFLRTNVEGTLYRTLQPGWVLGLRLRGGTFVTAATIGAENFVSPEERFFGGGASSVRGYSQNELGPGIWLYADPNTQPDSVDPGADTLSVEFIPSGGTSISLATAELRFPSPVFSELLRGAVFLDAGTVGLEPLWQFDSQWRVTPGFGVRAQTPVGPVRVDFAYNPYPRARAPLYVRDPETNVLERVARSYRPPDPSFLQRFRLHVAVGQPF